MNIKTWFTKVWYLGTIDAELTRVTAMLEEVTRAYEYARVRAETAERALARIAADRMTRATREHDVPALLVNRKACVHVDQGGFCEKCGERTACTHERWTFKQFGGRCPDCNEMMVDLSENLGTLRAYGHRGTGAGLTVDR